MAIVRVAFLFCAIYSSVFVSAHAKEISESLPAGIVYPGFAYSPAINPSGTVGTDAAVIQALYSPPIWGSTTSDYGGGGVYGTNDFGLSAQVFNNSAQTSWLASGSFRAEDIRLGASVSSSFGSSSGVSNPVTLALGGIFEPSSGNGVSYGAVLNGLNGISTQVILGAGYGEKKKYNLEINLELPPFTNLGASSEYVITVAVAAYAGIFGVSYIASTPASTLSFSNVLMFMVRPFKGPSYFTLQFNSSQTAIINTASNNENSATFGFDLVL